MLAIGFHLVWGRLKERVTIGKSILIGVAVTVVEFATLPAMNYLLLDHTMFRTAVFQSLLKGTLAVGLATGIEIAEYISEKKIHAVSRQSN